MRRPEGNSRETGRSGIVHFAETGTYFFWGPFSPSTLAHETLEPPFELCIRDFQFDGRGVSGPLLPLDPGSTPAHKAFSTRSHELMPHPDDNTSVMRGISSVHEPIDFYDKHRLAGEGFSDRFFNSYSNFGVSLQRILQGPRIQILKLIIMAAAGQNYAYLSQAIHSSMDSHVACVLDSSLFAHCYPNRPRGSS